MASNPQNHALVTLAGEPESDFSVTAAEALALGTLGTGRAAL
jgi:hypothetical protein